MADSSSSLAERSLRVEMLILDVDGVLTDGRIIYDDAGREMKCFHVRDGSGLEAWRAAGKRAAILSGRRSPAVEQRAKELGISPVMQGDADKLAAFGRLLKETGIAEERVCYVGDDLPDLPVLARAGLAVAVANACREVRAASHYVTRASGGQGAVRETIEWILGCQGRWDEVIKHRWQVKG
jgi:3-deoxy-D-manno-octulosonate 8-phosphate phosphatase (KDO 8-P phosphatase)